MAKIGRKLSELELLEGSGGGGGGGYKVASNPARGKNRDEEALKNIAVGFGAPAAGALIAGRIAESGDTESKREADRERKIKKDRRDIPSFAETPSGYKKGGSVSSRADGIAQRGKTKGRMC